VTQWETDKGKGRILI